MDNKPVIVVSFSGGRTSARFCKWVKEKYEPLGYKVVFVFMDTGMEHPATYDFVRKVNEHLELNLVCLRTDFNMTLNKANSYEIVDINSMTFSLMPFFTMLIKHGTPYVGGAFCTDRLKDVPFTKYCEEKFGKGNYKTLLGIRYDEPARMVGDNPNDPKKSAYKQLIRGGYDDFEISDIWRELVTGAVKVEDLEVSDLAKDLLSKRLAKREKNQVFYMGEALDDTKSDIIAYWKLQPFDLEIDEHLGNCVFCIKKSINKLALAIRDERDLYNYVVKMINDPNVRLMDTRTQKFIDKNKIIVTSEEHRIQCASVSSKVMYRYKNSLESIASKFAHMTRQEIRDSIRSMKNDDSGSCSESCEAMVCGMDNED